MSIYTYNTSAEVAPLYKLPAQYSQQRAVKDIGLARFPFTPV